MLKERASLAATAMLAVAAASALSSPASATIASCDTIHSVNALSIAGTCDIGDKRFTLLNTPGASLMSLGLSITNADLSYSFAGTTPIVGPLDDSIYYSIQVIPVYDPQFAITSVSLHAEFTGNEQAMATSFVRKYLYSYDIQERGILVASHSTPDDMTDTPLSDSFLYVQDFIHIAAGATLTSVINTFVQAPLDTPEPASLALFGAALAGLGLARRRQRHPAR